MSVIDIKENTNTFIRNITPSNKNNILLWVVNSDGSILIKNKDVDNSLSVDKITITGFDIQDVISKLPNTNNLEISEEKLILVEKKAFGRKYNTYFLMTNFSYFEKKDIEKRYDGKFIHYISIVEALSKNRIIPKYKELFLTLITGITEILN